MGNYLKVPDHAPTNKKFVKFFRKCKTKVHYTIRRYRKAAECF